MLSKNIGIIGYGSAAYDKKPRQTIFGYLGEAARNAIKSAGIRKDELNGISVDATNLGSDTAVTTAEYFGLSRGASYEAAKRGEIPTIKIGKLLRVPVRALENMLNAASAKSEAA